MSLLKAVVIGLVVALTRATPDAGPTYGKDYSGQDFNVTQWHSPSSWSDNHWQKAALTCASLCEGDEKCYSWTYCVPGHSQDPERCCLKYGVPPELSASTHWTGLSSRGKKCATEGNCPNAPPSPANPHIHYSPVCVRGGGWHDIAGALTFKGTHHVFQGCPDQGGWHHAASTDLVHWEERGLGPVEIHEPWGYSPPCSGFVVVDDEGTPCAGFRQCGSDHGMKNKWDVPLEIRCAKDANLTQWSDPIWLYDVFFDRALPYDPVRPWKGNDGLWYSTIATDACNGSSPDPNKKPCSLGSADHLWRSPKLHGDGANWTHVGELFVSNCTVLRHGPQGGDRYNEFVTPEYFGAIPGDPRGGATRVFTDNGYHGYTMYFVGTQEKEGAPFIADYEKSGAFDWSAFTSTDNGAKGLDGLIDSQGMRYGMARTLGSDSNQVTVEGRRVQVAWLNALDREHISMSLPRVISLDADGNLCQQFVPELKMLREPSNVPAVGLQLEVAASFDLSGNPSGNFGVRVMDDGAGHWVDVGVDPARDHVRHPHPSCSLLSSISHVQVYVDGSSLGGGVPRVGPLWQMAGVSLNKQWVHIIVDHTFVVAIFNNRTAIYGSVNPPSNHTAAISTFGIDEHIKPTIQAWALEDANPW